MTKPIMVTLDEFIEKVQAECLFIAVFQQVSSVAPTKMPLYAIDWDNRDTRFIGIDLIDGEEVTVSSYHLRHEIMTEIYGDGRLHFMSKDYADTFIDSTVKLLKNKEN